jgi:hypothetical protein
MVVLVNRNEHGIRDYEKIVRYWVDSEAKLDRTHGQKASFVSFFL